MRRPAIRRSAFQPIKKNFTPALSTRFASTDAQKEGKIHQVIGAIVDVSLLGILLPRKTFPPVNGGASPWPLEMAS